MYVTHPCVDDAKKMVEKVITRQINCYINVLYKINTFKNILNKKNLQFIDHLVYKISENIENTFPKAHFYIFILPVCASQRHSVNYHKRLRKPANIQISEAGGSDVPLPLKLT